MSSEPLLQSHSVYSDSYPSATPLSAVARFFIDETSYEAIHQMLNADDEKERDELTKNWRDHKLQELNFVGTVGALLAGCLASTGAWPDILDNGRSKPWTVRAIWHGGLVFALFGVLVAAQQSMRLHRLSSHRDGYKLIRGSLARAKNRNGWHPHAFQVYAWEVSIVFLVASVFCTVAGLSVLLWVSTAYGPNKPEGTSWWDENSKMAVSFTGVLGLCVILFFGSQAALVGTGKRH